MEEAIDWHELTLHSDEITEEERKDAKEQVESCTRDLEDLLQFRSQREFGCVVWWSGLGDKTASGASLDWALIEPFAVGDKLNNVRGIPFAIQRCVNVLVAEEGWPNHFRGLNAASLGYQSIY